MQKVLSGLYSHHGLPSGSASRQKSQYFAMKRKGGGTTAGIWDRNGMSFKKLFNGVDSPQYWKRYRFYLIAESSVLKYFNRKFQKFLNHALATAI